MSENKQNETYTKNLQSTSKKQEFLKQANNLACKQPNFDMSTECSVLQEQTSGNLFNFLPNFPQSLPQEPFDFMPPPPNQRYRMPMLSPSRLSRRIYIEMTRAVKDYGDLENLAPAQDKQSINQLKSQMQILSLAMLNVHQNLAGRNSHPFYASNRARLPRNYGRALAEMYNRVYYIMELTARLYTITQNTSQAQTILIILLNLKSQLRTLNNLLQGA